MMVAAMPALDFRLVHRTRISACAFLRFAVTNENKIEFLWMPTEPRLTALLPPPPSLLSACDKFVHLHIRAQTNRFDGGLSELRGTLTAMLAHFRLGCSRAAAEEDKMLPHFELFMSILMWLSMSYYNYPQIVLNVAHNFLLRHIQVKHSQCSEWLGRFSALFSLQFRIVKQYLIYIFLKD